MSALQSTSRWLQKCLLFAARSLHVEQPQDWRRWLLRLFVLPEHQSSLKHLERKAMPDLMGQCANQLGIGHTDRVWSWFWRLFFKPAEPGQSWNGDFFRLLGRVWGLFTGLWQALGWTLYQLLAPLRWAIWLLEKAGLEWNKTSANHWMSQRIVPLLEPLWLRVLVVVLCLGLGLLVVTTPFTWRGQLVFLVLCWSAAMVIRRQPGRYPGLALAMLGLLAMGRYAWWRLGNTLTFDTWIEAALGTGLLLAEAYTWLVVVLGFVQSAWPLERKPAPLPEDTSLWPTVDVFIPTYNEPMSVVRPTTLAAMSIDWPKDKLRVYILDDGRRSEFREFADSMGIGYIIRANGMHAKAGNLNHALTKTDGELIAIFDCDHMPIRSFLKSTVGWFLRDPRIAMLQTPHHFFSPDPFERNLKTFRRVPNEGALFYGLLQDSNDLWNATFFCGSCAVIRRGPLLQVGGIAVETVTEDAHTALKLQRLGYHTAYINQTLAAGLATESLSAHVGQRIRWARGMAQIFRVDNPFLGKGLSLWQRICYANAMLHFFFGLPRLVFMTAPMCYLFFEWHIIDASAALLALYVVPYILQSNLANAHIQGKYRHTFWAEVYETVLAWYVALPTTVAIINPKLGKFNVTAKGGLVEDEYFDWGISKPYLALVLLNFSGFMLGIVRLFFLNSEEPGTVLLNLMWTVYNMVILGASIGIAAESRQLRSMHRVASNVPAVVYTSDGRTWRATCTDFSLTGLGLEVNGLPRLDPGTRLYVSLWAHQVEHVFPARVAGMFDNKLGLKLESLSKRQEINLVQCTFAHVAVWNSWTETQAQDRPLKGLQEISQLGIHGYKIAWRYALETSLAKWRRWRTPSPSAADPTPPPT